MEEELESLILKIKEESGVEGTSVIQMLMLLKLFYVYLVDDENSSQLKIIVEKIFLRNSNTINEGIIDIDAGLISIIQSAIQNNDLLSTKLRFETPIAITDLLLPAKTAKPNNEPYVVATIEDIENFFDDKASTAYVDSQDATILNEAQTYASNLITQLIDGAPADSNTLKELSDKIIAIQAIIGGTAPDGNSIVDTVAELLAVFSTFPEGVDLINLLAGKVNTTDVYNALDCVIAGKVADARTVKALNDSIVSLNSSAATLATDQIFSGIKTFLTGKLGLRNVANTFTSFFTNSNTASRTYTLQDKSGTIAHLDDVFSKTYKTYFINTATGNNATGVYQDASKPFQSIDYINANFTIADGDIFYLQGTGQTYAINNQLQNVNQSFIAGDNSTNIIDFSSNNNTYITPTSATNNQFTIKLPNGTLRCERSGGTGVVFITYGYGAYMNIDVKDIYWNTSTVMSQSGGLPSTVKVSGKISARTPLVQTIDKDIFIPEFVCLAAGASYTSGYDGLHSTAHTIKINKISGSGSYTFYPNQNYIVGNISTTLVNSIHNFTTDISVKIQFENSVITGGGIQLAAYSTGLVLSGVIKSVSSFSNLTGGGNGMLKFVNFTADFGTNSIKLEGTGKIISFENCSIKSTNSPLGVFTNTGTGTFIIKNSAFEVVNAVPLMTGGAGGTRTLTVAGLSTNATMLSDQNGAGVTVTQFPNY